MAPSLIPGRPGRTAHEISDRLDLFNRHVRYRESDHPPNVARNISCGGGRLEDLNRMRDDPPYIDALDARVIPIPTVAGDFIRRFTDADVLQLTDAFSAVRARLRRGRGRALLGPVAYLGRLNIRDERVDPQRGRGFRSRGDPPESLRQETVRPRAPWIYRRGRHGVGRGRACSGTDGAGDGPVGRAAAGEWRPSAPPGAEVARHRSGHVGPCTLAVTGPIPMYANFWIRFPSKVSVV